MRKLVALGVISVVMAGYAVAHDTSVIIESFSGTGAAVAVEYDHADQTPWAGWVKVEVTNTGTEAWGDFHFSIYEVTGDVSNVEWKDASLGGNDPVSSQALDSWTIDNAAYGATIDLFYYNDPILPTETATFEVYNVNPDQVTFFGVAFHPTPVPEPAGLVLLALGALALRRR